MKNKNDITEDGVVESADTQVEANAGCQVRRKIEELLERRRYEDELGDIENMA